MNPEHFKFEFAIDDDNITVKWTRLDDAPRLEASFDYPELQLKFKLQQHFSRYRWHDAARYEDSEFGL